MVVDALGWRRVLGSRLPAAGRPAVARARGAPSGAGDEMEIWIDRRYVPAGYGWSFPAGEELRIGVGSFDPRFHVKDTTVLLAEDLERDPVRYQGNWIPHRLRDATEDGIFFVGDSAGSLPAADRGGHPHRPLLRHRLRARAARRGRGPGDDRARRWPATATSRRSHAWKFDADAARAAARPARPAAPAGAGSARDAVGGASSTGRSGTTWRSRRRSSLAAGPPPRAAQRAPARSAA